MNDEQAPWHITVIGDARDAGPDRLGVKGWYLEQLEAGDFPTPPGFVIEADAYREAIRLGRIDHRLAQIWEAARHSSPSDLPLLARKARHLIAGIEFSAGFQDSVQAHLDLLASRRSVADADDELRVAVRSSATPGAVSGPECAGVHSTYLSIAGLDRVLARVHSCWASLFGERALAMRGHGLGDGDPSMAVVVQTMIDADKSGFITPTGSPDEVLVEATFGFGEPIMSGAVEPDRYVVDRTRHVASSVTIGRKRIVLHRGPDTAVHRFAEPDRVRERVVDDAELAVLSTLSAAIDEHLGALHEVEWSTDRTGVHAIQARPFTPTHHVDAPLIDACVNGIGIGLGWATGRVRVIDRYEELDELRDGEILVTAETTPEWRPHIRRAAAVITDEGDTRCHAARVAVEEGLPAIVGTKDATTELESGQYVTVDASRGWVFPSVTFATST
ncbi:MAG: PEP/pyruvate-binding domain-containing protein [Ilumatobacter sp.]|uniref:PEP/pyruvate-binding domain-containing protein n=1 Tax=Ilumatobacter sp. TaxID=1967498 RepID=UPI00329A7C67